MDHSEDDVNIADILTIENEALRNKLTMLTDRMERLENRYTNPNNLTNNSNNSFTPFVNTPSNNNNDTFFFDPDESIISLGGGGGKQPKRLDDLEKMMVKIQLAKSDALKHGT